MEKFLNLKFIGYFILILIIFSCDLDQKNQHLMLLPSVKDNSIINKFSILQPEKIKQAYSPKSNALLIRYNNTQQIFLLKKLKKNIIIGL